MASGASVAIAAEAFIASQRHEGWVCLPEHYDDGGFTGANMDRPALRILLSFALNRRGWTMKQWVTQKGKTYGGGRFTKSSLHGLLTNMAYIGRVNYKGHIADAEVPGLVPDDVFQAAQECLKENCRCGGSRVRNKHNALLGGILRCGHCDSPMTHAYTKRGSKVYRYYVCNRASKEGWDKCPAPSLPAAEVEKFVVEEIGRIGEDEELRAEIVAQHEANRKEELSRAAADKRKLERQVQQIGTAVREAIAKGESTILADLQRQQADTSVALAELAARITTLHDQGKHSS